MKIQSLFDLLRASQDLLFNFEGVETAPQLVSRLEKLKRPAPDELLADVENLRDAVDELLSDTLEMSGSLTSSDEEPDSLDGALDAFPELDGLEDEPQQDAPGNELAVVQADKQEKPAS